MSIIINTDALLEDYMSTKEIDPANEAVAVFDSTIQVNLEVVPVLDVSYTPYNIDAGAFVTDPETHVSNGIINATSTITLSVNSDNTAILTEGTKVDLVDAGKVD